MSRVLGSSQDPPSPAAACIYSSGQSKVLRSVFVLWYKMSCSYVLLASNAMNNFDCYICYMCIPWDCGMCVTHDDFIYLDNITYTLPLLLSWFRFCSESSVSQTTPRNSHYMKSTVETVSGSNSKRIPPDPYRELWPFLLLPFPPYVAQFHILYSCSYTHHCPKLCVCLHTALLLSPFNTTPHHTYTLHYTLYTHPTHTPPPP